MAIGHMPVIPKRTTQGTKLSSYQHDYDIHEMMRQYINAIIDNLNANPSPASFPAAISLEWNSNTLPTEFNALFEDGTVKSRALYPRLFAIIGTSFNIGGETGSEFRLPNKMGRISICANPMNGQNSGLSTRTFATYIGAETNSYTPTITVNSVTLSRTPTGTVTLSPYTPSGTVAIGNVTATGTIVVSGVTPSGTITVAETAIPYTPQGTVSVILTNGTVTGSGDVSISGQACTLVSVLEGSQNTINCDAPLVASIATVAAGLTTAVSVNSQDFTGTATDFDHTHTATFTGSLTTPTATFTGTPVVVTGTFTGATSAQTASFAGVVKNFIITY